MTHRIGQTASAALAGVFALAVAVAPVAAAETLESALARAYNANPSLNAQRASVRAVDENVSAALSGYRPRVTGTADYGASDYRAKAMVSSGGRLVPSRVRDGIHPSGYGVTVSQTLFNGMKTSNSVRQSEFLVLASREQLRSTEQTVLLDAATAYMNVLRDYAIFDLRRRNVDVLDEQLRATKDRFNVGEVTRTDVAQAEARVAGAQSQMALAEANLKASRGIYRQRIGVDPVKLAPGRPVDRKLAGSLDGSIKTSQIEHPDVQAAMYNVDAAEMAVKVAEAALSPTVSVDGSINQRWESSPSTIEAYTASVVGRLSVPFYQGGSEYSAIRQAKETLGQRRIEVDVARDRVRSAVIQSWGQLEAAKAQIEAAQAQVTAAETALNGVREEARVGQRTTLDVLNAQQELLDARVTLVSAQRDRVVASYTLLASSGRLNRDHLGLKAEQYDPKQHYDQVRDSWIGVRTPDGR